MAILSPADATYFVGSAALTSAPHQSFRSWLDNSANHATLVEGTPRFSAFQQLSLCEAERYLLLSASNYRRAHDLISAASVSWAFVTLYYSSFYAAIALMGVHGAWLGKRKLLQPVAFAHGSMRFDFSQFASTYKGSHERFWDFYFTNAPSLAAHVNPSMHFALYPVSSDVTWLTRNRNSLNYDSFEAVALSLTHRSSFSSSSFRGTLPGALNTQFRFADSLLSVAGFFAEKAGLETVALSSLSPQSSRVLRIKELVLDDRPARLGNQVKRKVASTAGV